MNAYSRNFGLLVLVFSLTISIYSSSQACSVCLSGDDLYLYGREYKLNKGQLSFSLENRYFSKTSGPTHHSEEEELAVSFKNPGSIQAAEGQHAGEEQEKLREYRPVLTLTLGVSEHLTLSASVASSVKRLEEISSIVSEVTNTSGLGDMQFGAMWNTSFGSGFTKPYSLGLFGSLKVPTGQNNKMAEGTRLEEHVQPGTGTWDIKSGFGLAKLGGNYSVFMSFFFRLNGTNDHDYHFGNAYLFNVGLSRKLAGQFSFTGEVNGRYANQDEEHNEVVPNSGGWVFYLTPGIRYQVIPNIGLVSNVQIPVLKDLHDEQREGAVFNLTVRYDLL